MQSEMPGYEALEGDGRRDESQAIQAHGHRSHTGSAAAGPMPSEPQERTCLALTPVLP